MSKFILGVLIGWLTAAIAVLVGYWLIVSDGEMGAKRMIALREWERGKPPRIPEIGREEVGEEEPTRPEAVETEG